MVLKSRMDYGRQKVSAKWDINVDNGWKRLLLTGGR